MTVQPTRDQLRALADKATPGPWMHDRDRHDGWMVVFGGNEYPHGYNIIGSNEYLEPGDAAFIAAAREALPQLLNYLDAAEQRIRDLTQEVRDERAACLDQIEQVQTRDARIKAARELHQHGGAMFDERLEDHTHVCASCLEEWPCPTIRALDGEA